MGVLLLLHVLLVAVAARAPAADAWGKEGHYMVCKIAESFLTEEASTAVKDLLPGWAGGDLAETCSWADTQRFRYRWSSPLHFADTPGDCEFDYALDPTESLMFLAHFVGDVHQPLHCGHTDDLGGNTIVVHWYRRKTNLHHVWDVNVIETAMKDFYDNDQSTMIQAIQQNITEEWANEEKQWETCRSRTKTCAEKYAAESAKLACTAYEGVEQDSTLEDDYFFAALPVVQKRIAQGGVRLAAILNKIFGGKSRLQIQSS
ncbi:endonuclease 2-like isoform X2 [Miscanthus floridulus]|uniref:endonuclease 2-like isoform X2 n=1 Tax=Miscanthus floridulus TaxID=154761 RepID=UPI0034585FE2